MTTSATTNFLDLFVQALGSACADIFSEKGANKWTVTAAEKPEAASGAAKLVWIQLVLEGAKAEAAIQISADNAALLTREITGQAVSAAQLRPEHLEAVKEAFAKACIAVTAQPSLKKLKFRAQLGEIAWTPGKQIVLTASAAPSGKISFQLLVSAELLKLIQPAGAGKAERNASTPNLTLLEDVELDVTLRFGSRQLALKEIADIRSGSLIELDKEVQEPAELLLGERVIARGEVVVVEGNYGLRITEVV